jgi:hypothetical protein
MAEGVLFWGSLITSQDRWRLTLGSFRVLSFLRCLFGVDGVNGLFSWDRVSQCSSDDQSPMLTAEKEKASSRCASARSGDCTAKETLLASCGVRFFFGDTAPLARLKWLLELKEASSRWRRLPGVCSGASTESWASCWSILLGWGSPVSLE